MTTAKCIGGFVRFGKSVSAAAKAVGSLYKFVLSTAKCAYNYYYYSSLLLYSTVKIWTW